MNCFPSCRPSDPCPATGLADLPAELIVHIVLTADSVEVFERLQRTCRRAHAVLRTPYVLRKMQERFRVPVYADIEGAWGHMSQLGNVLPDGRVDGAFYSFAGNKLVNVQQFAGGVAHGWELFVSRLRVYSAAYWRDGRREGPQYDFEPHLGLCARKWWRNGVQVSPAYHYDPVIRALRHVTDTDRRESRWSWSTGAPDTRVRCQAASNADVEGAFCGCGLGTTAMEPRAGPACSRCWAFWDEPVLRKVCRRGTEPVRDTPAFLRLGVLAHGVPDHAHWGGASARQRDADLSATIAAVDAARAESRL